MADLTKILLFGGGAFLLYEWIANSQKPATTAASGLTPQTPPTPASGQQTAPPAPVVSLSNPLAQATQATLQAYINAHGDVAASQAWNGFQWNYIATAAGLTTPPDPSVLGLPGAGGQQAGTAVVSMQTWLQAYMNWLASNSASGSGTLAGLGERTTQLSRDAFARLARNYYNQRSGALRPARAATSQNLSARNYWDHQRTARQLPYRWTN